MRWFSLLSYTDSVKHMGNPKLAHPFSRGRPISDRSQLGYRNGARTMAEVNHESDTYSALNAPGI